jgi:hypothetical protein
MYKVVCIFFPFFIIFSLDSTPILSSCKTVILCNVMTVDIACFGKVPLRFLTRNPDFLTDIFLGLS